MPELRGPIESLRSRLGDFASRDLDPPADARIGAALVLLDVRGDHPRIVLTRRQPHLSSHPGQISFPGGRVDPGESIEGAALREASEEIGLRQESASVLGRLPAFYIPPSRFWMSTVVAVWERPHVLTPNQAEVAEILTVDVERLKDPAVWRSVPLSRTGMTWAWDLGGTNLLWGATAVVTSVLLEVIDQGWSSGTRPEDLPTDQHVKPWEEPATAGLQPTDRRPRARLRDVPDVEFPDDAAPGDTAAAAEDGGPDRRGQVQDGPEAGGAVTAAAVQAFAGDVVEAVERLVRRPEGPVVVLVGTGQTGAVAQAAARLMAARDEDVVVVAIADDPLGHDGLWASDREAEGTDALSQRRLPSGAPPAGIDGPIGVVIDGMLGRGFVPPLREPVLGLVRSLARTGAPLISLDLPSGIDPREGMIGDAVSADVTIAVTPLVPAHRGLGVAPFLGDIYVSRPGHDLARAVLVDRPTAWAE